MGPGSAQQVGVAPRTHARTGLPRAELGYFAETAVNVGFACQLLSENTVILEEVEIM